MSTTCSVSECDKPSRSLGYCRRHYEMHRRKTSARLCERPECGQKSRGKRLCSKHLQREKAGIQSDDQLQYHARPGPNASGEHRCSQCRQWLPSDQFHKNKTYKWGLTPKCRTCQRFHRAASNYGVTVEFLKGLLAAQGCRCAGCGEPFMATEWHVDHDHSCCPGTKRSCGNCVRGLLCSGCNCALGFVRDSTARLLSLADYLHKHQKKASSE
ncbi:hypothetical protein SEA_GATOR_97 [Mycobacterium phage Gator]|nr:hypothetical protein SEA_CZYSZCZON1_100 [Mycobacterium phage Czyszczon1]QDK01869.1 hypothetical protein SEA_GATOR_97 [Mycobacterium phage Gator]